MFRSLLIFAIAFLSIALVMPGVTLSQVPPPAYSYGYGYGGWPTPYLRHSSTYEEGVQRGYADVVRSWGMSNLLNAEAAKAYEQARRDYLDNRLKATQTYFEMRRYNQDYRNANRPRPLTTEEYVRLARLQAPDRLSVSQLDPFTGQINWPVSLRRPEYDEYRQRIERLFRSRAGGTVFVYDEIDEACDAFVDRLQLDIEQFEQNDYIRAKNFVQSLAYEAQLVQR
ncbi:MAG TPA: hypothetical protein VFV87_08940 [Pirellulaceae bacterium]|nr:hypothetical protein [Pirellulaceae bacterium]